MDGGKTIHRFLEADLIDKLKFATLLILPVGCVLRSLRFLQNIRAIKTEVGPK